MKIKRKKKFSLIELQEENFAVIEENTLNMSTHKSALSALSCINKIDSGDCLCYAENHRCHNPPEKAKAICIETTFSCNLACTYCFVRTYSKEKIKNSMMSFDTAKRFIDNFSDARNGCTVGFFGGEPTLNTQLIYDVVNYMETLSDKNRFSITTNGLNLSSKMSNLCKEIKDGDADLFLCEWLNNHKFSMIVSLDGDSSSHDEYRKKHNGEGSHSDVIRNLLFTKNISKPILNRTTLRGTFTSSILNSNSTLKTRLSFLNEKVTDGLGGHLSIEPVTLSEGSCINKDSDMAILSADIDGMHSQYNDAIKWYVDKLNHGINVHWHQIDMMIRRIINKKCSISECGAGCGYLSCKNDGVICACHRTHNSEIGSIYNGIDEQLRAKWIDNRWYSRKDCPTCDIRNICGGGCRESSIGEYGDISMPVKFDCELKRIMVKCALYAILKMNETAIARYTNDKHTKHM